MHQDSSAKTCRTFSVLKMPENLPFLAITSNFFRFLPWLVVLQLVWNGNTPRIWGVFFCFQHSFSSRHQSISPLSPRHGSLSDIVFSSGVFVKLSLDEYSSLRGNDAGARLIDMNHFETTNRKISFMFSFLAVTFILQLFLKMCTFFRQAIFADHYGSA